MVDYVYWATVDPLTVEQAARLWANVEPEMPTRVLISNDKKAVASRLQILKRAIIEGTLRVQSHTDDQASVGDHRSCLVQRVDLTAFALSRSEKPNFLFAPGAPSGVLLSEIEHLIADGSPLLQRAIEDALRRQRGRTGNTNQGAGEVVDAMHEVQPAPSAEVGAGKLSADLSESRGEGLHRRIREWKAGEYPTGTALTQKVLAAACARALGLRSLDARTYRRALGRK